MPPRRIVELPYGRTPYLVDLTSHAATILEAPALPPPPPVDALLEAALDEPLGAALPTPSPGSRVTLIVSDTTRHEPRDAFIRVLRRRFSQVRWTLAVASGTHASRLSEDVGITADSWDRIVEHDGGNGPFVDLGVTSRGTPIRVNRCVVETDLLLATGCIRPHYFAGFGAGVKAVFPGLGESTAIRANHQLKLAPGARAGVVVGNPCRDDLEEAVARVPTPIFMLNGVCGPDDAVHAAVAGDPVIAFRRGAELARPWFTVRAPRAPLVIASDALPVSASLYQAAKIAAAAAPFVADHGTLVVVAECAEGIEPLAVVNEAIFRIGVLPRLPPGARLLVVSALGPTDVERTLLEYAPSVQSILERHAGPLLVLPRASHVIGEPT